MNFFGLFIIFIFVIMLSGPFVPVISDYALPIVGILFLIGGLGAGFISGAGGNKVWQGFNRRLGWSGTLSPIDPHGSQHPLHH